jgi:hypothetical protein
MTFFHHRFDGFSEIEQYLEACKSVLLQNASIEQINQLAKCDGYTLVDKVLGFKPKTERKKKTIQKKPFSGCLLNQY